MSDRDRRALRTVGVTFLIMGIVLTAAFAIALYATHDRVFAILITAPGVLFLAMGTTFFGVSHAQPRDNASKRR
jgi:O-antigen/teichoic acid export membrane protein